MKPNTKQCKDCFFWGNADGSGQTLKFCNYLLITGKRRKHDGDKCLSKKPIGDDKNGRCEVD